MSVIVQTGNTVEIVDGNQVIISAPGPQGPAGSGGGGTWGSITGTLSNQTDLNSALGAKQNLDATLTALAGAGAANTFPYFTATDVLANGPITAFGLSLLDDANAAAARTTLGMPGGGTVVPSPTELGIGEALIDVINGNDTTGNGTTALPYATAQAADDDGFRCFRIRGGDAGMLVPAGDAYWIFGEGANKFFDTGEFNNTATPRSEITFRRDATDHVHIFSDKAVRVNLGDSNPTENSPDYMVYNAIIGDVTMVGATPPDDTGNPPVDGVAAGYLQFFDSTIVGDISMTGGDGNIGQDDVQGNGGQGGQIELTHCIVGGDITCTVGVGASFTASVLEAINSVLINAPTGVNLTTSYLASIIAGVARDSASGVVADGSTQIATLDAIFDERAATATLTNKSIAYGQLTGLGTGVGTWLGTPTLANLNAAVSDADLATLGANTFTASQTISTGGIFTPQAANTANQSSVAGTILETDGNGPKIRANGTGYSIAHSGGIFLYGSTVALGVNSTKFGLGATASAPDVIWERDAANEMSLRRTTNAQQLRVYDTYGSSTDYHRIGLKTRKPRAAKNPTIIKRYFISEGVSTANHASRAGKAQAEH